MKNTLTEAYKNSIVAITKMTTAERNFKLCELVAKVEILKNATPLEIIQLEFIQAIRKANGEIDRVLKNWEENPELDPRINN